MCLASGSTDGTIRFWNPRNGEELVTFTSGHIESVKAVAFSKDGTILTTAALMVLWMCGVYRPDVN